MNDERTKRGGGFVPISHILPGFEDLIPPPQAEPVAVPAKGLSVQRRHHYTQEKQLDALISIADDPQSEMGFMTRMLALCSLPRTDPGARLQYKRQNGPFKLVMIAGGDNRLPFGNLPRLLLAWVSSEAVRTQQRDIVLGPSLASFMRQLGMNTDSGGAAGNRTRLRTQIDRLFNAQVQLIYETPGRKASVSSPVAVESDFWWDYKRPEQDTLWNSRVRLGEGLFNEIVAHPIPLDMRILRAMKRSSLGLDLYMWLSYKTHSLYVKGRKPERLSWDRLYRQFGADPEKADDKFTVRDFRKDVLREIAKLKVCWPTLDVAAPTGCLEIRPCAPSIAPKAITG